MAADTTGRQQQAVLRERVSALWDRVDGISERMDGFVHNLEKFCAETTAAIEWLDHLEGELERNGAHVEAERVADEPEETVLPVKIEECAGGDMDVEDELMDSTGHAPCPVCRTPQKAAPVVAGRRLAARLYRHTATPVRTDEPQADPASSMPTPTISSALADTPLQEPTVVGVAHLDIFTDGDTDGETVRASKVHRWRRVACSVYLVRAPTEQVVLAIVTGGLLLL